MEAECRLSAIHSRSLVGMLSRDLVGSADLVMISIIERCMKLVGECGNTQNATRTLAEIVVQCSLSSNLDEYTPQ